MSSWTSMRRRRATVPLATSAEWAWGGSLWRMGSKIFQMLLVIGISTCIKSFFSTFPFLHLHSSSSSIAESVLSSTFYTYVLTTFAVESPGIHLNYGMSLTHAKGSMKLLGTYVLRVLVVISIPSHVLVLGMVFTFFRGQKMKRYNGVDGTFRVQTCQ